MQLLFLMNLLKNTPGEENIFISEPISPTEFVVMIQSPKSIPFCKSGYKMKERHQITGMTQITPLPLLLPPLSPGQLSRTVTQVCSPFLMKWPSNQNAIRIFSII